MVRRNKMNKNREWLVCYEYQVTAGRAKGYDIVHRTDGKKIDIGLMVEGTKKELAEKLNEAPSNIIIVITNIWENK
jgi:hypothetical protein